MKYVKMLGIAVGVAAVLMALGGAGTASATVLCKNNESTSSCNENYPSGTEFKSSLSTGTKTILKTEFKTVECSKSTVSGKTETGGSATETVKGPLEALTFEECNCEVKVLKKGTLEIHWISGGTNGTVTETGAEVTVNCSTIFGNVHCIYVTENTDLGTLTGGNPASLDVNASIPRLTTNALCTPTATWEASYEVTAPKPLYVTQDALLVFEPDNLQFKQKNEVKFITIRNRSKNVIVKTIAVVVSPKINFKGGGLCEGVTLEGGGSCAESVECVTENSIGAIAAASVNPKVSTVGDLKC
jgi:hypothetical protein